MESNIGKENFEHQMGAINAEFIQNKNIEKTDREVNSSEKLLSAEPIGAAIDSAYLQQPTSHNGIPSTMPILKSDQNVKQVMTTATNPIVASDEDLIEKEWVDRAKKIIADTQSMPRERESAVIEMRNDYKNKRYGKS